MIALKSADIQSKVISALRVSRGSADNCMEGAGGFGLRQRERSVGRISGRNRKLTNLEQYQKMLANEPGSSVCTLV